MFMIYIDNIAILDLQSRRFWNMCI